MTSLHMIQRYSYCILRGERKRICCQYTVDPQCVSSSSGLSLRACTNEEICGWPSDLHIPRWWTLFRKENVCHTWFRRDLTKLILKVFYSTEARIYCTSLSQLMGIKAKIYVIHVAKKYRAQLFLRLVRCEKKMPLLNSKSIYSFKSGNWYMQNSIRPAKIEKRQN